MDENNKFNEEMNSRPDEDWNKMLQADAQLQEQPAEQEPAKKAKSKKPFIIIGIAVAVVALAAILIALFATSPLGIVAKGAKNTAEALAAKPAYELVEKMSSGGSVETVIDLAELDLGVSLDGSINAKFYTDLEKQGSAVSVSAVLEDMTVLDMLVVMEKQELALSSQVLLGERSYGVDLEKAPEKFDSSIFGYNGAYSLGIESLDDLLSTADSKQQAQQLEKHAKALLAALAESVKNHSVVDKESAVLDFDGDSVKTHAVSLVVDDESAVQIVLEMLEYVLNNAELKEFLYANPSYAASVLQLSSGYSLDAMDMSREDAVAALDELYADMEDLASDEEELRSHLEGFALELVFHVSKSDKYLIGIEAEVKADGEEYEFEIIAGPNMESIRQLRLSADNGYGESSLSYTVQTNDKADYASSLRVRQDGDTVFSGSIDWNKESGDLVLDFEDESGDAYGLEGKLVYSEKTTEIELRKLTIAGDSALVGIDVILDPTDRLPDMPEYTELLDMSETEFAALADELSGTVQELVFMLYSMVPMGL